MTRLENTNHYVSGVRAGDRGVLSKTITLIESQRHDHRIAAQEIVAELLPHTGNAHRIGITGVPGVGKSTVIDQLGMDLLSARHKVAVLAVDPSSTRTGGSILGDKTRMSRLASHDDVFIRPSPTSGTLGGVARATRETILVMEAAGYDVVLVETVGIGQSEVAVANMVDTFVLLTLARAGDQLHGIKKGVLELADVIAVNKADGDYAREAKRSARELSGALRIIYRDRSSWIPPVLTCSALENHGIDEIWREITRHRDELNRSGALDLKRQQQRIDWTWSMVRENLFDALLNHPEVRRTIPEIERSVQYGEITPGQAADRITRTFREHTETSG